jgi:hypothetical protein
VDEMIKAALKENAINSQENEYKANQDETNAMST